jgi:uncharacterized protein (DUF924 family)
MKNTASIVADLLSFWIGDPAPTSEQLLTKFQPWYQGGPELDQEIRQRYGALIEDALAGDLESWRSSVSGRLSLLVLLDQFTRNVFRGTPRAYEGDRAALALATETIDTGLYRSYSLEERLFVLMPLVHAEDVQVLSLAVLLAEEMVREAEAELREPWALGAERVRQYRALIERFGRFPARNAILGRSSSAAELSYLTEQVRNRPPRRLACTHGTELRSRS